MKREKDPSERVEFGRHWGDWSTVIMAVLFLIAFLVFLSTDFLAGLDKTDQVLNRIQQEQMTKAEKEAQRREISAAEATGVVQVGIAPAKKPQK
jgi:hypothetical protein